MKALIVDDEKHVRNTVLKLVDWEGFGFQTVLEAEDGAEAAALIEEHRPQLVITDMMMPIKSGIELMEWMDKNAFDCKKIVISGFNDFEFVRHTVKFGGIDYLLKPIDRKQLQDAVSKAVASWNETKRERLQYHEKNKEVNELKPLYRDKLLSGLLTDAASGNAPAAGESYLREFPYLTGVDSCRVAVFDLHTLQQPIRDKYAASLDLLFFTLLNICNEFLQTAERGLAFRNWNRPYEIVVLLCKDPDEASDWLRKIAAGINRTLRGSVEFGLSTSGAFPDGLHKAYNEAADALHKRNLLEPSKLIHEYSQVTGRVSTIRFGKYEEKVRLAVRSGNPDQIRHALSEWFQVIGEMNHISLEQLKMWWDEYNAARAGWVEEFFREYDGSQQQQPLENCPFIVPLDESGRLSLPEMQRLLTDNLVELSKTFISMQTLSISPMREIARYIEAHYTQDIRLQDISASFHLNREYISRKFKMEFGETLIDYVNRIRVEKAMILLLNPHLRMTQIAQMIGYHDEKYFSRVFKKLTHTTPNDYRKEKMGKEGE